MSKKRKNALAGVRKNPRDGGRGYSMTSSLTAQQKEPVYNWTQVSMSVPVKLSKKTIARGRRDGHIFGIPFVDETR